MNYDKLYVAICTPNDRGLQPYVYGIFLDGEYAVDHFNEHGDKDSTVRVTHECVIRNPAAGAKQVKAADAQLPSLTRLPQWEESPFPWLQMAPTLDECLERARRANTSEDNAGKHVNIYGRTGSYAWTASCIPERQLAGYVLMGEYQFLNPPGNGKFFPRSPE